jgi:prepilin-type N-terminal cleavage/methylation domain-containing protein/prepilin-type processing-associated H-X9-DG protein
MSVKGSFDGGKPTMRKKGFTLIELLVVIAIIALLMAILLPTLQRVRRQGKAVACQSNLRQWGTVWAMGTAENDGYLPDWKSRQPLSDPPVFISPGGWYGGLWSWYVWWGSSLGPYWGRDVYNQTRKIRCCPMAAKPASPTGEDYFQVGGTFLAWGRVGPKDEWPWDSYGPWEDHYGSYGDNASIWWPYFLNDCDPMRSLYYWRTAYVKGASNIPVLVDSPNPCTTISEYGPPLSDAIPISTAGTGDYSPCCINRHDGFVNCLFMDWSVRKVGLKELWTLKWHRQFNTANRWTKAGGVKPEDWPPWMRRFKDY